MHGSCLAAILCLACLDSLPAENPDTKSTPEQLVQQLSSREFRVRDQAAKALAELGLAALPVLQKEKDHQDPEVRRRIQELIPPLERSLALEPKRVTMHMTNKTVKELLAELSKQTGYKVVTWPENAQADRDKQVHTLHVDKLTFWEALDKICELGGLVLQSGYWGDESLRLHAQDSYVPFACLSGPFKVMATGFNYNRSNSFAQLPRSAPQQARQTNEYLQLNLQVGVEPKLPILRVGAVRLLAAEDEEGNSMVPVATNAMSGLSPRYFYGGGYRSYLHSTQTSLVWTSKSARVLRSLKGVVPVTLLADQKPSVVTDQLSKSKGKKIKIGSSQFHIEDYTEMPGKQFHIKISIAEDVKDNPNDYTRINTLQQRLEIRDEKGTKLSHYFNSISTTGASNAQFTIAVQPGQSTPTKLLYYSWTLMDHEIPFEFSNLPLP